MALLYIIHNMENNELKNPEDELILENIDDIVVNDNIVDDPIIDMYGPDIPTDIIDDFMVYEYGPDITVDVMYGPDPNYDWQEQILFEDCDNAEEDNDISKS